MSLFHCKCYKVSFFFLFSLFRVYIYRFSRFNRAIRKYVVSERGRRRRRANKSHTHILIDQTDVIPISNMSSTQIASMENTQNNNCSKLSIILQLATSKMVHEHAFGCLCVCDFENRSANERKTIIQKKKRWFFIASIDCFSRSIHRSVVRFPFVVFDLHDFYSPANRE